MPELQREKVHFFSGGERCAAWHYPGTNGACVVMGGGLGVIKEPATDPLAHQLNEAGFGILAFDFRGLGESEGSPRQVVSIRAQQADWQAAIDYAATLPGVAPGKVAIWGFSLSGGHVFCLAASNPQLAAAIAHSPLADGPAVAPNAMRGQTVAATLRLMARGLRDALGSVAGREPLLVPLSAPRGTVAALSTPDALNSGPALNPGNRYPDWQQEIAARSAVRLGWYRPGRRATAIRCPLLVLAYEHDGVSPPKPAIAAGRRAPRGRVEVLPGGHYESFLGGQDRAVEVLVRFLQQHLSAAPAQQTAAPAR